MGQAKCIVGQMFSICMPVLGPTIGFAPGGLRGCSGWVEWVPN